MAGDPFDPMTPRGVRGLSGTIAGAVAAGKSLAETTALLRSLYGETGGRFTSQTEQAIASRYAAFTAESARSRSLSHVRGSIGLTARWISFARLDRPLASFVQEPRYYVRFAVDMDIEGERFTRWQTALYEGDNPLPATVGELRGDLDATAGETYEELLGEASFTVSQVAIYAR